MVQDRIAEAVYARTAWHPILTFPVSSARAVSSRDMDYFRLGEILESNPDRMALVVFQMQRYWSFHHPLRCGWPMSCRHEATSGTARRGDATTRCRACGVLIGIARPSPDAN